MSYADDPDLLARLYEAFRATPLHALLGLEFVPDVEVPTSHTDQGTRPDAVVSMPVRPEAYGSTGNLHGGAVATLIDVAAATAAARSAGFDPGRNALVTADLHVRYLKRPHGDVVHARARVLHAGRSLVVVECRVVDREDRLIAAADFSSMLVDFRAPLAGGTSGPGHPEM